MYLECSNVPGGPPGGKDVEVGGCAVILLTPLCCLQPQRVCGAEAHRHQQEVLHQLQAVVPEENLWQIHVSMCDHPRLPGAQEAGLRIRPLQGPSGLGRPLEGRAASGAVQTPVQTRQGAVCLGAAVLVSWLVLFCIFKAPDETWVHFSGLI